MEIYHWIGGHGFALVEGVGIIASLIFATIALRREERSRHIGNLLAVTAAHREIWSELFRRPDLKRILNPSVDVVLEPVTAEESLFVTFLILHLDAVFKANRARMFVPAATLRQDIAGFFSLPIPKAVWQEARALQDTDFVSFVENALAMAAAAHSSK
jgi:hypothetical protein